jgi:hypothetical protein
MGMTDDLQTLLDASFERASEHLRSIMTPERRLTAERIVSELPCPAILNLATVTARGEPRLSAVDGHFIGGHWYFTTAIASPKAVALGARPAVSASFTPRDGYGVFCHGRAVLLDGAEQAMLRAHFTEVYGMPPEDLGDIAYFRIDAEWLVGFAMTPDEMAEIEAAARARS